MTPFVAFLLLLAAFYSGLVGLFAVGFRRVIASDRALHAEAPVGVADEAPFASVVVAARNEAGTIGACLQALLSNDYPEDRYEVIVVDDFSSDATASIVRRWQCRCARVAATPGDEVPAPERLRLVRMRDHAGEASGHKRHALAQGLAAARGDVILTTDADCRVQRGWIRTMLAHLTPETAFVSGPVCYRTGRSLFGRLQALEFLGLIAVGAGGIGIGLPNMCNSANVAYRRAVQDLMPRLDGAAPAGPGDDEVLLQRLVAETPWQVRFCAASEAVVLAEPERTAAGFLAQRRRWAGTGARYPDLRLVASLAAVYAFYLLLTAALVAAPLMAAVRVPLALALAAKIASEALLLVPACRHFGYTRLLAYFLPEQLVQIPYVVYIGAAGVLGKVHWKGRRIG